ncbi:hypothetical protein ABW21_db0207548 [Orbilia brochopaga]|nr:hypothetical protein ABW21_db0207548 [Drechslerella brochopaga]
MVNAKSSLRGLFGSSSSKSGSSYSGSKSGSSITNGIGKGIKGLVGNSSGRIGKNLGGSGSRKFGTGAAPLIRGSKKDVVVAVSVVFGIIALVIFFILGAIIVQRLKRRRRIKKSREFGGLASWGLSRDQGTLGNNHTARGDDDWTYDSSRDGVQLNDLTAPDSVYIDGGQGSWSHSQNTLTGDIAEESTIGDKNDFTVSTASLAGNGYMPVARLPAAAQSHQGDVAAPQPAHTSGH